MSRKSAKRSKNSPRAARATHTHTYWFWHVHDHGHAVDLDGEWDYEYHDAGHYHEYMNTHDHGKGGAAFHTHQLRMKDEPDDEYTVHHHGVDDHTAEEGEEQVMHAPIQYQPKEDN